MGKLNVLEISKTFGYAGTERVLQTFCLRMDREVFNVYPVATHSTGPREAILKEAGMQTFCASGDIDALLEYAEDRQTDVVHVHRSGEYDPWDTKFFTELKRHIPSVTVIETNVFGKYDPTLDDVIDKHLNISKMMLIERYIKSAGRYDPERMSVLPNPIDFESITNGGSRKQEVLDFRRSLGVKDDEFLIGKIGRPDISKWSDLILEMFPLLIQKHPKTKFLIRSLPRSRELDIRKMGSERFILLPPTVSEKEIGLTYLALDAYVHSSKIGESFGMTLLEAGAYGKPVVVNSTPWADNNQVDLIRHGENGYIANTPESFADAISYLIENPDVCHRMGEVGQEYAKKFDSLTVTRELESIILSEKKRNVKNEKGSSADMIDIARFSREYQILIQSDFRKQTFKEKVYDLTVRNWKRTVRRLKDYLEWKKSTTS